MQNIFIHGTEKIVDYGHERIILLVYGFMDRAKNRLMRITNTKP